MNERFRFKKLSLDLINSKYNSLLNMKYKINEYIKNINCIFS